MSIGECPNCGMVGHPLSACPFKKHDKQCFKVKDSGKREEFDSGMVRDTTEGKVDYTRCLEGPMLERWAAHLAKGAIKYPDVSMGVANWTLASGPKELHRFKVSALRHMIQWMRGETDEDHAAAVFFNLNGAENVKEKVHESHRLYE